MKKLIVLLLVLATFQGRTQEIGYLVVKDTFLLTKAFICLEIDSVQKMCPLIDVDESMFESNYFEFDNGVVYYYVERKRVVRKNGKIKLRRIK